MKASDYIVDFFIHKNILFTFIYTVKLSFNKNTEEEGK